MERLNYTDIHLENKKMTNKFENNNKKRTLAQVKEITQVDSEGVVQQMTIENTFQPRVASEPHYIKEYQQDFHPFNQLKKKTKEIFKEILIYTTYNKNTIYLNQQIKVDICNKLDIAYQTMTNALTELKKSELLFYINTGLYVVNPYYYAKGEWAETRKIRDKIKISESKKSMNGKVVEIFSFDYSEISEEYFDKSKLKKAKPKTKNKNTAKPKTETTNKPYNWRDKFSILRYLLN